MLEVFDELGLKPSVIAGCSIGALMGAAYAGGMSAKEIRDRAETLLVNRLGAMRYAFGEKRINPFDLLVLKGLSSLHIQGDTLVGLALPDTLPTLIEDLPIPFKVIATDFDMMEERVIESGPLRKAVAASIAIPGVILGPQYDGHTYVDGGVTNPVPFDHVRQGVDIVVAIDVTGRPRAANGTNRSNMELAVGSLLILFHQVAGLRRAITPPDIYIRPAIDDFTGGDFFRIKEVLGQTGPAKDELKRELEKRISALA
jgi:NTE family protein